MSMIVKNMIGKIRNPKSEIRNERPLAKRIAEPRPRGERRERLVTRVPCGRGLDLDVFPATKELLDGEIWIRLAGGRNVLYFNK